MFKFQTWAFEEIVETELARDEKKELENIRAIRRFIIELAIYLIVVPLVCFVSYVHNGEIRNGLGLAVGWGFWLDSPSDRFVLIPKLFSVPVGKSVNLISVWEG